MSTSIVRHLSKPEITDLSGQIGFMGRQSWYRPASYRHLVVFDGTRNDRNSISLSGNPHQTNIANIFDLAKSASALRPEFNVTYQPGVGTGGRAGGFWQASLFPTNAVKNIANDAYLEVVSTTEAFLVANPQVSPLEVNVGVVGYSRGTASGVNFAHRVNKEGLVRQDGKVVVPPGVPVYPMVMLDPVQTGVKLPMCLPSNVKEPVLVVQAQDENRQHFEVANYRSDARVRVVTVAGNHAGVGGGQSMAGTGSAVLEGVSGFLRNAGIPLADVPGEWRFNPRRPVPIFGESFRLARNGDVIDVPGTQKPHRTWPLNVGASGRATKPLFGAGSASCSYSSAWTVPSVLPWKVPRNMPSLPQLTRPLNFPVVAPISIPGWPRPSNPPFLGDAFSQHSRRMDELMRVPHKPTFPAFPAFPAFNNAQFFKPSVSNYGNSSRSSNMMANFLAPPPLVLPLFTSTASSTRPSWLS